MFESQNQKAYLKQAKFAPGKDDEILAVLTFYLTPITYYDGKSRSASDTGSDSSKLAAARGSHASPVPTTNPTGAAAQGEALIELPTGERLQYAKAVADAEFSGDDAKETPAASKPKRRRKKKQ